MEIKCHNKASLILETLLVVHNTILIILLHSIYDKNKSVIGLTVNIKY